MIRFSLLYVICAATILTTSCVVRRDVKVTEYHGPTPLVERLPIKVYAYYSDKFCSREVTQQGFCGLDVINEIKTQIGEANVELFEYILTHTFSSVKSIPKFPVNAEALVGVDLIIKPKLLDFKYGDYSGNMPSWVGLSYLIQFYLPDGTIIDNWKITGQADMEVDMKLALSLVRVSTWIKEHIQLAMRDVSTQFFLGFCSRPRLRKIFDKECRK